MTPDTLRRGSTTAPASRALLGSSRTASPPFTGETLTRLAERAPTRYTLPLAALIVALLAFSCEERVPVNGGLGWDGAIYARWARSFHEEIFVRRVDTYYIQRILPSAVIHYSLRAFSLALTDRNVMRAFGVLSVLLIALMGYLWALIASRLRISGPGTWLGFCGLFLNYVILKHTFYCQVTTDVSAYAIGLGMLYCYLEGWALGLYLLTFVGAFVWPLAVYIGAVLLLFPKDPQPESVATPPRWHLHLAVSALVTAVALVGIRYVLHKGPALAHGLVDPVYIEPIQPVVHLSILIALVYLFMGLTPLLRWANLFDPRSYFRCLCSRTGLSVVVLLVGVRYLHWHWSNKQYFMGVKDMLALTGFFSVAKPGVFLVTHAAYYGPFFLLALLLWRPVCRLLHRQGVGLTLAVLLATLFSLNSQSRYFINVFVMVIPFIVQATESLRWRPLHYGLVAGLCVLCSKVWLKTNCGPFTGRLLEFPDQYLFMSHGPWISTPMYLAQGAAFLVVGYLLYQTGFREIRPEAPSA